MRYFTVRMTHFVVYSLAWAVRNSSWWLNFMWYWSFKRWRLVRFNWVCSAWTASHGTAAMYFVFITSVAGRRRKPILVSDWWPIFILRRCLCNFCVARMLSNVHCFWKTNWFVHSGRWALDLWLLMLREASRVFQKIVAARPNLLFAVGVLKFGCTSSSISYSPRWRRSWSWALARGKSFVAGVSRNGLARWRMLHFNYFSSCSGLWSANFLAVLAKNSERRFAS